MEDLIKGIFANKLVSDDRESVATITIPGLGTFGLYAPVLNFWIQLFALLLFQISVQCTFGAINYQFIVKQRGSTLAFLTGFGAVIPVVLWLPYQAIAYLDIQNIALRLPLATLPAVVFCRTFEAMFGTSPAVVERSMGTYLVYYSCLIPFEWNIVTGKRNPISSKALRDKTLKLLAFFHAVSLFLSFEAHYNYMPFGDTVKVDDFHFNLDLLSPGHLANTYCLAVLTYLVLRTGFDMVAISENFKGFVTIQSFDNPLFSSRSPSDFWGRKWNLIIHKKLKHGTYLPAKQFFPTWMAVFLTFVSSGLLHDYTWSILFTKYQNSNALFSPVLFKLSAFFCWNGVVILLEKQIPSIGRSLRHMTKDLPLPVVSTLVVLTALPVSHWYTGDWALGGLFGDYALGLWQVRFLR